jgi:hypothetical protein
MRWIDIRLNRHEEAQAVLGLLNQAEDLCRSLPALQRSAGLDSPAVVELMRRAGQLLFRAVTQANAEAFSPAPDRGGVIDPEIGSPEPDCLIGYHLVVDPGDLALPWTWLHNGVFFLLEKHPVCASQVGSHPADSILRSPWMKRFQEALLSAGIWGERPLRKVLGRLRPRECADPEILFVPGHCESRIRRLIYREGDGIRRALAAGAFDRPLARLVIPTMPITPDLLARRGGLYQGLHFAGPVSRPLHEAHGAESAWLVRMLQAPEIARELDADNDLDPQKELEVVGVDPITAVLDEVSARASRPARLDGATSVSLVSPPEPWLLEDGPVRPEQLGRDGWIPPLVFSNSYCSLPALGARFLNAGASLFAGPLVPLYSRPARKFAGRFYNFLGDGYSVGAALRTAALACRAQFGEYHPVWLSYGMVGYGSLALQYL